MDVKNILEKETKCKLGSCCKKSSYEKTKNKIIINSQNRNDSIPLEEFYESKEGDHLPLNQMICYEPIEKCAEKVTDLTTLLAKSLTSGVNPIDLPEYNKVIPAQSVWPVKGELSIMTGFRALENYLQSLEIDPTLKYCINFISQKVDNISTTFLYEVKFSMPTNISPVQLSSANVLFKLRGYYTYPAECPVEVEYSYEYSSMVYRPGDGAFNEGWLLSIIDSKKYFRQQHDLQVETFL